MEIFAKIVNGEKPLTNFPEKSTLSILNALLFLDKTKTGG